MARPEEPIILVYAKCPLMSRKKSKMSNEFKMEAVFLSTTKSGLWNHCARNETNKNPCK